MPNSTRATASHKSKPQKPRPDFPLFPHASGRWAKKIRGKFVYFGKVTDDPKGDAALNLWLEQKDELLAGRKPRDKKNEVTVKDVIDTFLASKERQLESGDLIRRTFDDYLNVGKRMADELGRSAAIVDLRPIDFEKLRANYAKTLGPAALTNWICKTRSFFRYAYESDLIQVPVKFGPHFKPPGKKAQRELRNTKAKRVFTANEIKLMLGKSRLILTTMIMLGINCGFGNHDCAALTIDAVDLKNGWIDFPRPKTGVPRRCPLWPETVDLLRQVLEKRKQPKDAAHSKLLFIGATGTPYVQDHWTGVITVKFYRLTQVVGIRRAGLSFYALRHTFETIGGDSRDQVAVNAIMGHVDSSMAGVYRERIEDARLVAVSNHVHAWLFGKEGC